MRDDSGGAVMVPAAFDAAADAARPWWKRRRTRALASFLLGVGLAFGCSHLPEQFREPCKLISHGLAAVGL